MQLVRHCGARQHYHVVFLKGTIKSQLQYACNSGRQDKASHIWPTAGSKEGVRGGGGSLPHVNRTEGFHGDLENKGESGLILVESSRQATQVGQQEGLSICWIRPRKVHLPGDARPPRGHSTRAAPPPPFSS